MSTDTVDCHDFKEIQKFEKYMELVSKRRKENKKNGIKFSQENATKLMMECYEEIYG
jgi:hypothetical protein